jgi:hypothetical protein
VRTKPFEPDIVNDKAIFFMETSSKPFLTSKQLCGVEAAAKSNPGRPVIVGMLGLQMSADGEKGRCHTRFQSMWKISRYNVQQYLKNRNFKA